MATAPHMYPAPYSGPIGGWKYQSKHRIIENIPEVIIIISKVLKTDTHKLSDVSYYTCMINSVLKETGSSLSITRTEYVHMANRFKKFGEQYFRTCVERATILSEFSV